MPSDTPEVLEKLKMMRTPKRMQIGGHRVTVFLTDYDESSDSFFGEAHRNRSMEHGEVMPAVQSLQGLRPYPYTTRPDYAFQFVEVGEDEQPLIDIAQGNVHGSVVPRDPTTAEGPRDPNTPPSLFNPADTNRDGIVSDKEQRKYDREHKS